MSGITENMYQKAQEERIKQLNEQGRGDNLDDWAIEEGDEEPLSAEDELADAIANYEIAKLEYDNAQLRRQAELHEATRDRLRQQRDRAIARIRAIRDLLDSAYE